jgi:hypothetical protein
MSPRAFKVVSLLMLVLSVAMIYAHDEAHDHSGHDHDHDGHDHATHMEDLGEGHPGQGSED